MIREAIAHLVAGVSLSETEAAGAMEEIMTGAATAAQIGSFLTALRLKGETVDEVAGLARVMREQAVHVPLPEHIRAVDTCGTGGDAAGTFNVSTAAGLVVAASASPSPSTATAPSSRCGSADVLEALGVRLELGPEQVAACVGRRRLRLHVRADLPPGHAARRTDAPRDRHSNGLQHPWPADQSGWRRLPGAGRCRCPVCCR